MKLPVLLAISLIACGTLAEAQSSASISGIIKNSRGDSITCICGKKIKAPLINNRFNFNLTVTEPIFINVTDETSVVNGLIEPGDSIYIIADFASKTSKPEISGKGKEKFLYIQHYDPVYPHLLKYLPQATQTRYPLDYMLNVTDSIERQFTILLESYNSSMSLDSYNYLLGDTKGHFLMTNVGVATHLFKLPSEKIMEVKVDSLSDAAKKFFGSYMDFNDDFYRSAIYRNTVSGLVYEFCERNQSNKSATLEAKYQCISKFLPPKLLPRVVAQLISLDIDKLRDKDDLERIIHRTFLNAADSNTKNYLLHKLEDVYSLKVGSSAPDFVLENQNGEKVTLASFTGKVVFMDFWFDACGPCHEQFKNLKPVKEHFKNNKEVVFLNISIDNRYNWLKGIENPNIAGMHVYTEGKESNHTVVKDYKVHGYPTNRIIGKNGNIFLAFPARNPEELINQIDDALKSK